jgi:hypothetical protein
MERLSTDVLVLDAGAGDQGCRHFLLRGCADSCSGGRLDEQLYPIFPKTGASRPCWAQNVPMRTWGISMMTSWRSGWINAIWRWYVCYLKILDPEPKLWFSTESDSKKPLKADSFGPGIASARRSRLFTHGSWKYFCQYPGVCLSALWQDMPLIWFSMDCVCRAAWIALSYK